MVLCIVCDLHLAANHMLRGLKMALSASGTLNSPASRMSSILQMGWHTEKHHAQSIVGILTCMEGYVFACLFSAVSATHSSVTVHCVSALHNQH